MKTERELKMLALTAAKDHLERGLVIMAREGYTPAHPPFWEARKAVIFLRADIDRMRDNDFIVFQQKEKEHAR